MKRDILMIWHNSLTGGGMDKHELYTVALTWRSIEPWLADEAELIVTKDIALALAQNFLDAHRLRYIDQHESENT